LLPVTSQLAEAKISVGGVIYVLMGYIFAFSFGVSLGPILWNVCSEVNHFPEIWAKLTYPALDLSFTLERKVLHDYDLHSMAIPGI
jgi:hypothetical protein